MSQLSRASTTAWNTLKLPLRTSVTPELNSIKARVEAVLKPPPHPFVTAAQGIDMSATKSPLEISDRRRLSVSNLIARYWCELQSFYELKGIKKARTAAMKKGSRIHKQLERKVHREVVIDRKLMKTGAEVCATKFTEGIDRLYALITNGEARELYVFAPIDLLPGRNGADDRIVMASGYVDRLQFTGAVGDLPLRELLQWTADDISGEVYISDTKTRVFSRAPPIEQEMRTWAQLSLYHYFFRGLTENVGAFEPRIPIYSTEENIRHFMRDQSRVDVDTELDPSFCAELATAYPVLQGVQIATLRDIAGIMSGLLQLLRGKLADTVRIDYYSNTPTPAAKRDVANTVDGAEIEETAVEPFHTSFYKVDLSETERELRTDLEFWLGRRAPRGIETNTTEFRVKCHNCAAFLICDWRKKVENVLFPEHEAA